MTKEELLYDINDRFRFGFNEMRNGLYPHEKELIYDVYPKLSKDHIDSVLDDFETGNLKPKALKRAKKTYYPAEGIAKGVKSGSLSINSRK